ncbi:protein of unknown function [Candidatus Filomicrobium marinum]|uniref:Uncharacterized protein n=1 Tax=Candidatus Filomicrobium marinum TaxID=1608628 RepID=A0A0D6JGP9_9HYPH|nr:protein of unknown function [Candidatus Filomicrobium marinum]CPR20448.1 protein of unknown function [Candidatus Filomicrobium marinum]
MVLGCSERTHQQQRTDPISDKNLLVLEGVLFGSFCFPKTAKKAKGSQPSHAASPF